MGGLGNQMFQYAFHYELLKQRPDVYADLTSYERFKQHNGLEINELFNLDIPKASQEEINYILGNKLIFRFKQKFGLNIDGYIKDNEFNKSILRLESAYLAGYWQSEEYFRNSKDSIRQIFNLNELPLSESATEYKQQIKNSNSVSVHIRRGDYISNKKANKHHVVLEKDYYIRAIKHIQQSVPEPKFFFFSDDPNWVKANFDDIDNKVIVCKNNGNLAFQDMVLMSLCKHNIIANSSFSWWGAWLNNNSEKIVLAPNYWFVDKTSNNRVNKIVPPNWIKI